jgi:hypothetical protein
VSCVSNCIYLNHCLFNFKKSNFTRFKQNNLGVYAKYQLSHIKIFVAEWLFNHFISFTEITIIFIVCYFELITVFFA